MTEDTRAIYQEIYKTGNAVKRLKDINTASAITYLLDSTLASQCWDSSSSSSSHHHSGHHNSGHHKSGHDDFGHDDSGHRRSSSSSSSSSSGSWEDELHGENATAVWQLQLNMMAIIATMAGSTKSFPVQFNENAGR